jgi:hypothetical protein
MAGLQAAELDEHREVEDRLVRRGRQPHDLAHLRARAD